MSGSMNKRNRHQAQPNGFVATLSPEGQVNKIVADLANYKEGDNLRVWSASAHKELAPTLTVHLLVGAGPTPDIHVPKLPLLVASPVVRDFFVKKPTAEKAKFVHADIAFNSVRLIANWLKNVCMQAEFPEILIPDDMREAMKLRLAMHTLGMQRYTGHIDACYADSVQDRVPDALEVNLILDSIRKDKDPILIALANRISYLMTYHKISQTEDTAYINLFSSNKKYQRLLNAVNNEEVQAMAARERELM